MSTPSTIDPNETIESVLMRAPSCSLVTPKATKRAHIRPLKRVKFAEGDAGSTKEEEEPEEEQEEEPEEKREALEPRRLDMDQHVVLANPSSSDEEEDEQAPGTQRVEEEGELPPEPQKSEPEEH
jgi:hypothetical protein